MKKFFALIAALAAVFAAQSALAVGVKVNGTAVSFSAADGSPFIENGRTLVPLRAAAEAYGAKVDFDSAANAAIVMKDGVTVTVPIGENKIYRNGEPIKNDAAAKIVDSRTYLPIRAVMEAFGAQVGWDGSSVSVDEPDIAFVNAVENGEVVSKSAVWGVWNSAQSKQASGDYYGAIELYRKAAPAFKSEGVTNMALLFQHLGECYAKAGEYSNAAVCYRRSSHYWSQAGGQEQTALHYANLAEYVESDIRLYLKTDDESYNRTKYFGAPNENESGILLGTTAYSDTSNLTGTDHSLELQYIPYGKEFAEEDIFRLAKKSGNMLQIALQPLNGLDAVSENSYLIRQAEYLESLDFPVLLRFANEMNDTTCQWYTKDYNKYIEKFRIVAKVFKEHAPSVGIIWSPNFYPSDTIDLYYPGDEYVDYVGLSVYQEYTPENDPLGEGIERGRWSAILDRVYETYGDRKPIIVSEGGCSYRMVNRGTDITQFAEEQMLDYYTYLPIKYPNLKMAVLFNKVAYAQRKYLLSENSRVLEAYKKGIASSGRYITSIDEEPEDEFYYELHNNFSLPAETVELCSYITCPLNDFDYVVYEINGGDAAAYSIPYTASVDLSPYAGQTIELRVRAYTGGSVRVEKTFKIQVDM